MQSVQERNDATLEQFAQQLPLSAPLMLAFAECSDNLRKHAVELLKILADPTADDDDRFMATTTLAELLIPNPDPDDGMLGMDLERCEVVGAQHSDEALTTLARFNSQEGAFADRLAVVMKERGVSQTDLANRIGKGQPAIAMMLQRKCRPQRATVSRLAEALGVSPDDLWPSFSAEK